MKICWDNLEKFRYDSLKGYWYTNRYAKYLYRDHCQYCNEPFLTKYNYSNQNKGLFCSRSCSIIPLTGPQTEDIRNKISKKLSGSNSYRWKGGVRELGIALYDTYAPQINYCESARRDPNNYDWLQVRCTYSKCRKWYNPKVISVSNRIKALNENGRGENRFYCSEECKQLCPIYNRTLYRKGEAPNSNRDPVYNEWAEMVKERDDWTCQRCGSTDRPEAHHMEGLNENDMMSLDLEMGITLCHVHHKDAHSEIGCRYVDLQKQNVCK